MRLSAQRGADPAGLASGDSGWLLHSCSISVWAAEQQLGNDAALDRGRHRPALECAAELRPQLMFGELDQREFGRPIVCLVLGSN